MAISARRPSAPAEPRSALELVVVVLGAAVAIGVTVLFLALIGANRTSLAAREQSAEPTPLIQHYRAGAPRTATLIRTTPAHEPSSPRKWSGEP